jgi:hypothetical protein
MIRMNRLAICLSIAGLALAACGSEPDPDANAAMTAKRAAQEAAAAADPMSRMARAVGSGKPGAAVEIRYEFSSKPAVGTPMELQIAFVPHAGVDSMDIAVNGMDGLTLSGPQSASFAEVEHSKPYMHTVSVLPDRTGVFYVSVIVTTQIGKSNLSRAFSIPFAVGNVPAQQKAAPQTDASGQPVQPAKAQETRQPG